MSHLILVRHGQSEWNLENRFTGWVDVDLAPKGKIALAIGTTLVALEIGIGFGAFVSGSLFSSDFSWLPWLYRFCAISGMIMAIVLIYSKRKSVTTMN